MRRYQFPLGSVLRVRRTQKDLAGATLLRANLEVAARLEALEGARLHHDRRPALGGSLPTPSFAARQWRGDRSAAGVRLAEEERDAAARSADTARAAWVDAARRVSVLERLDERRRAEHLVLAQRAAEREIDDIVVGRYGRDG
jgi:flagellar export protein FliJ